MFKLIFEDPSVGTNKNARIVSRVCPNGKLRTETSRRDEGSDRFAVTTDAHKATKLFIDLDGGEIRNGRSVTLDGRQARSLYRLLKAHFEFTGK